ncbi:MAG TPA: hypothetical protein VNM72_11295 [Blastocatellia bacterium]|nr:hypothetical protein [Blastocatellia bacterium]
MKTLHWAEVQRGLLTKRADLLVRLAFILLGISALLTGMVVLLSRFRDHGWVEPVIFGLALGAVILLIIAFGLVLPVPLIVHELKEMDEVVAEQTRRHY